MPSQAVLKSLLYYDPETGALFWKERPRELFKNAQAHSAWNSRYAGKPCFRTRRPDGYLCGGLFGKNHLTHRVVWVLVTGEEPPQVDHINGDRKDNRWGNLRSVLRVENARNMKRSNRNSSGVTGVTQITSGSFQTTIGVQYLGCFETLEEAAAVRKAAEHEHGYHENHGRIR